MIERAERLGAALLVCGLVREPAAEALVALTEVPLLTDDEWEAWQCLDSEDIALAHSCLNVEFELRERQFAALERFGTAWATGTGETPEERVASMPESAARAALVATLTLGWDLPVPDGL